MHAIVFSSIAAGELDLLWIVPCHALHTSNYNLVISIFFC